LPVFRRSYRRWAALPVVLAVGAATMSGHFAAAAGRPGPTTKPVTLSVGSILRGFDIATSRSGTAYAAWIGIPLTGNGGGTGVHLCTIKLGTTSCAGGVQVINALDNSTASGLRVLVQKSGIVDLVWSYGLAASPQIGFASTNSAGKLQPASDMGSAPKEAVLLDAAIAPNGSVWTVAGTTYTDGLQVREGAGHPAVNLSTPYSVDPAELAFTGSTPVIATQPAGSITKPAGYIFESHGSWSKVHNVAGTWTGGARLGLADTRSGLRLIASEPEADYRPVISAWTGRGFSKPALTGDFSACSQDSHDAVADASGRLADIGDACNAISVVNFPDTRHAAVVRFRAGGTVNSGTTRVATTPRGIALALWSVEGPKSTDRLLMVPVRLPDLSRTVTTKTSAGSRRVTGPVSCLPAVTVGVAVRGRPAAGWHVQSDSLKLGVKTLHSTLDGATLKAGRTYRLTGTVTFAKGSTRRSGRTTLVFRSCPSP
jgi:hypothetical protein